jgi:hypothetical protein
MPQTSTMSQTSNINKCVYMLLMLALLFLSCSAAAVPAELAQ